MTVAIYFKGPHFRCLLKKSEMDFNTLRLKKKMCQNLQVFFNGISNTHLNSKVEIFQAKSNLNQTLLFNQISYSAVSTYEILISTTAFTNLQFISKSNDKRLCCPIYLQRCEFFKTSIVVKFWV